MTLNQSIGIGVVAVGLLVSASLARAVPISGSIGFAGGVVYNNASADDATAVEDWVKPQVTQDTGGLSLAAGTPATFSAAVWNFNSSAPVNNFWSARGFTFELLTSAIVQQGGTGSSGYVVVMGTGIISGNGYTPTSMYWMFTSQDPAGGNNSGEWLFSTSKLSANAVADGGGSAMLLAISMGSLAWFRRKAPPQAREAFSSHRDHMSSR
jgi:hypothetical protein